MTGRKVGQGSLPLIWVGMSAQDRAPLRLELIEAVKMAAWSVADSGGLVHMGSVYRVSSSVPPGVVWRCLAWLIANQDAREVGEGWLQLRRPGGSA